MSSIELIRQHTLTGLELVGTAAFALSGVLVAMRKRMDVVGICVCVDFSLRLAVVPCGTC